MSDRFVCSRSDIAEDYHQAYILQHDFPELYAMLGLPRTSPDRVTKASIEPRLLAHLRVRRC